MKKFISIIAAMTIVTILCIPTFMANISTAATTAPTGTRTLPDGIYMIRSAINNKFVMDVLGASMENGANVQLYEYSNVPQKKYKITYLEDGTYSIIATHSNKSIDVRYASTEKGANVQQWDSNGTDAQKWIIKDVGNGYYSIISKCNGLYVDVNNALAQNGTNIQMCDGNGLSAQKFKFEEVDSQERTIPDGTYMLRSAIDNKFVVDVLGASLEDEANVQLYEYSNVPQKKFKVTYLSDGSYSIIATHSNKALDVKDASKLKGANVQQYQCNGTDAQKWFIKNAGNGYYSIISKCNGLYIDVTNALAQNGTNIQMCDGNGLNAQKFKFEATSVPTEPETTPQPIPTPDPTPELKGEQTLSDGIYMIQSSINTKFVLDVLGASKDNGANVQLYEYSNVPQKKYKVTYLNDGTYSIIATHSNKSLDVQNGSKQKGANVQQYESNETYAQKWILKETDDGYYSIISKCNGLYVDVHNALAQNGTNIQMCDGNGLNAQKFIFREANTYINIDSSKYPGYKEKIESLMEKHPTWNFKLLYTTLNFNDAVYGEYSNHKANLVPSTYKGEWVCPVCGTTLYDSGWYGASEKAIAYYMDPRNFLDDINAFQFLDVNSYLDGTCTIEGIQNQVNNSFLQNYANDINTACKNKNVNPYYIISRLFQEQGKNGTTIGKGMDGGDGKTYYNPFNIGAHGDGYTEIYNNALAYAKNAGWDTMEKAIEGGIYFCKDNWLDNYQNTLYQNRFDIDKTNGSALYAHQYMQNLLGAYSEARLLRGMYANTNKLDSNFTFIIPVYENMSKTVSPIPSSDTETPQGQTSETYPMNVETTGTYIRIRSAATTDGSTILRTIADKGTKLLSVQRGVNTNWQKVVTNDGLIGYISGDYVKQIDDIKTCNYSAVVKTNDGNGCNIRIGPSTELDKLGALPDYTNVTVIDNSTYNNVNGYNWYRIVLQDGRQAFIPSVFLK